MSHAEHDIDALTRALYNLSALRRDIQRFAGIEHAVGGLMVLSVVCRIGPARISDVAAEMQVNLSVASRQIAALEDEGFVGRVPDPHDGRSSLVATTDAGRAKLDRAHRRLVASIATAVDDWEPAEVIGLADGIVRLRDALGACDPPSADPPSADRPAAGPAASVDRLPVDPTASADRLPVDPTASAAHPATDPTLTPASTVGAQQQEHLR